MLKAYNAVDFDDLIAGAHLLLQRRPRSADALAQKNPLSAGGRISGHQHQPVRIGQTIGWTAQWPNGGGR